MTKAKLPNGYSHSNQETRFKVLVLQEELEQERLENNKLTMFDELCQIMTTTKDSYQNYKK